MANLYVEIFASKGGSIAMAAVWSDKRCGFDTCMDDTFVLWPHGEIQLKEFHQYLNDQYPCFLFTRQETNDQLHFLRCNGKERICVPVIYSMSVP